VRLVSQKLPRIFPSKGSPVLFLCLKSSAQKLPRIFPSEESPVLCLCLILKPRRRTSFAQLLNLS